MMKYVLLLTAAGFQAAAGFQLAPTRMRAVHVLRAADYADAIEQDRVTLRRAAATKNEESDAVVDALLGLEQSCKERSRAEGASAGAAIADKLTGAWRWDPLISGPTPTRPSQAPLLAVISAVRCACEAPQ